MLESGDELTFYLPQEQFDAYRVRKARSAGAQRRQFGVVYEDAQVLIVSKPAGLLVHGDATEKSRTLTNQVCGYLQDKGEFDPSREMIFRPSPVMRIDRNTSGLVIFGKTAPAVRELTKVIRERDGIRKFYLALVSGRVDSELILTDRLQKNAAENRVSVTGDESGKASETHVRPVASGDRFSLVEAELITGRTHQIRVHLAKAGHPLLGDPKYGDPRVNRTGKKYNISSQLLHAFRLEFGEMKPPLEGLSGKSLEADLPPAFQKAVKELING